MSRQPMKSDEEIETKEKKSDEPIKTQLVKAMHDLYESSKNWRSPEQERAVVAVANGISPLFIIFPTEFGKSSAFLFPNTRIPQV